MKLNSKVTGGLAWAGLVVVLAVPSADMLTKPSASTATVAPAADALPTASIPAAATSVVPSLPPVPAVTQPVAAATTAEPAGGDVVEDYIASGKKLPSYISDAPVAVEQALAPVATQPVVPPGMTAAAARPESPATLKSEVQIAAVAPVPYPASMRPDPVTTAALPADEEALLILDEEAVTRREAALRAVEPVLAGKGQRIIDGEELEEWDSGSLAEYLERRGLISEAEPVDADYDPDGFFLSDGPTRKSGARVIRRLDGPLDFFLF